jgi:hypothetical protein
VLTCGSEEKALCREVRFRVSRIGLKVGSWRLRFFVLQSDASFFPRTSVSYSALHEGCKDLIKKAGLDPSRYSTHSAKRGSATEAVSAGCSDAEVTSLGRWRSANTGRQYVHSGREFRKKLTDRYSL